MFENFIILLALFNGFLVVSTRLINAKLGGYVSNAGASFWNHLVGFLFLALFFPFFAKSNSIAWDSIPVYLFLGGILGSGYVILNNFVIPKIGATTSTVLVIAGQITIVTIIDFISHNITNLLISILGISLVVLGMWVGSKKHGIPLSPNVS